MAGGANRESAAARAAEIELPSGETEEWRYSRIGELPLDQLAPVTDAPSGSADFDRYEAVADRAATVVLVDGWPVDIQLGSGWAEKGVAITVEHDPARTSLSADEAADGSAEADTDENTMFDLLHRAFSPGVVTVRIPAGLTVSAPIVVVNHQATVDRATFPHIRVEAGAGSDVAVVERQTSVAGFGLSVPLVELRARQAARLRYETVQVLDDQHWQLARLRSSAESQASLVSGVAAFGAHYARLRVDTRLVGRGATGNLSAAYYGDGDQVHDFRVYQHHDARDSRSDLLFKGAQDDASGSVYTGMIHIHPDGAGANAFQTNRNIKLSTDAWAWSVPNLEIENNDVRCSHASTVSPVDLDQLFYLQARGVPPFVADRLIVAGFFDEVIVRLPSEQTRDDVRRLVADKLDGRDRPIPHGEESA